jgi:4'-phosphopantetheinyl transferase
LLTEVGAPAQEISGVRIWSAHLEALPAPDVEELHSLLDPDERARAGRFHFEKDRRHYIAARGLLRRLLGETLDESPSALVFEYGSHGKPELAGFDQHGRTLRFNLSHSSGWAMFALAWDREVGIDLENASRLERDDSSLSGLAARILSARELEVWRSLPDAAQRRAAFLRAWTRKEAYVKATGRGVSDGLERIEVILDAAAPKSSLILTIAQPQQATSSWTLHDLSAPEGFASALTLEQKLSL